MIASAVGSPGSSRSSGSSAARLSRPVSESWLVGVADLLLELLGLGDVLHLHDVLARLAGVVAQQGDGEDDRQRAAVGVAQVDAAG